MTPSHDPWHLLLLLTSLVTSSQKVSSSGATTLNLGGQSPVEPFMPKKSFLWGPNSFDGVPRKCKSDQGIL